MTKKRKHDRADEHAHHDQSADAARRRMHDEEIQHNAMTGDLAAEQRHDPTGDANRREPYGESAKRAGGIGSPHRVPSFANTNIANTEAEQTATREAQGGPRLDESGEPPPGDGDSAER